MGEEPVHDAGEWRLYRPSNPGAAFPWGLLAQIVLLVITIVESVVENKKKRGGGDEVGVR